MKRLLILAALVASLAAVTVALGATTILSIPTNKSQLAFAKKALTAKAGKITLNAKNMSVIRHNIALRNGTKASSKIIVKGQVVGKNRVSTVTAKLKKGKYRYLCTVPGHEAAGMWGILTVK